MTNGMKVATPKTVLEYRDKKFLLVQNGQTQHSNAVSIRNGSEAKFLDLEHQTRPILAFGIFLAGRKVLYVSDRFYLIDGAGGTFLFATDWLESGIRLEIA